MWLLQKDSVKEKKKKLSIQDHFLLPLIVHDMEEQESFIRPSSSDQGGRLKKSRRQRFLSSKCLSIGVIVLAVLCGFNILTNILTMVSVRSDNIGYCGNAPVVVTESNCSEVSRMVHLPFNNTALFLINDYFTPFGQGDLYNRTRHFVDFARDNGATIFHLCYDCYYPYTSTPTNNDRVILQALEAGVPCVIPDAINFDRHRGALFHGQNRNIPLRWWPFRPPGTQTLEGTCAKVAQNASHMNAPIFQTCKDFRADRRPPMFSNSLRLPPLHVNPPYTYRVATKIYPNDVLAVDPDLVWRVLTNRGIDTILFAGGDANESVLWSRATSVLSMLRAGWPAKKLFVLPELCVSDYVAGDTRLDWMLVGRHLWSKALTQTFGIHSLCLTAADRMETFQGMPLCSPSA